MSSILPESLKRMQSHQRLQLSVLFPTELVDLAPAMNTPPLLPPHRFLSPLSLAHSFFTLTTNHNNNNHQRMMMMIYNRDDYYYFDYGFDEF